MTDLARYYAARANEYEKIYDKPERQKDLAELRPRVAELLRGREVLEVACGTGYWTAVFAETAAHVLATDINLEALSIAAEKELSPTRVEWRALDAFTLPEIPNGAYTAGFAGFWWSHLRKAEIARFLDGFCAKIRSGGRVVLLDNRYVKGSSTPISEIDSEGDTYQLRKLASGATHRVLKNFPEAEEVGAWLAPRMRTWHWEEFQYYWLAWGDLP